MIRNALFPLCIAAVCSALSFETHAQPMLRISNVALNWPDVLVSFSVTCQGEQVLGIDKTQITLEENGIPVNGFTVTCPDSLPPCRVFVSMVFDVSGSMVGANIEGAKAAGRFFIDALKDSDEASITMFNTVVQVAQPMTANKALLKAAIDRFPAGGGTALWNACMQGISELQTHGENPCTAMLVLSDGGDNASTHTLQDVITRAVENNVRVFTVALGTGADSLALVNLAIKTGGATFFVDDPATLIDVYRRIAVILQRSPEDCVLRYTGTCIDGGSRSIRMIVSDVCHGADTATSVFVAPNNTGRITPLRFALGAAPVPARGTGVMHISLLDTLRNDIFPPSDVLLRYDSTLLQFRRAFIPPSSLLPPGPVEVRSALPGLVHLRIPSRGSVTGAGALFDVEYQAADPADSAYASISIARWLFDDGCYMPQSAASSVCVFPCRWSPHVTPSGTMRLCKGDTLTLTGESGFLEYTWYRDTGFVAGTTRILRITEPGRYRLLAKDGSGCRAESGAIEVFGNPQSSLTAGNAQTIVLRPGEEVAVRCGIAPKIPGLFLEGGSADLQWASPDLALVSSAWLHPAMPGDSVADIAEFTVRASSAVASATLVPLKFIVRLPNACSDTVTLLHPTVLIDGHCEKLIARSAAPRISNAPNPVRSSTTISIELEGRTHLRAVVLDAFGREMAVLADGVFEAGPQQFRFDADGLAPGLYAVQATTNGGAALRTMLVLGSR